ncbi:MAG: protein kinase domain-containing protein, partial [Gemmataceae bacterium]
KVADMGLAACANARLVLESGAASTRSSRIGGTAAYMAPERFQQGAPLTFQSDVYSLGITFYEAIRGKLPFLGTNPLEYMIHHVDTPLPELPSTIEGVTPKLNELLQSMCAKNPAERPATYDSILVELHSILPESIEWTTGLSSRWQPLSNSNLLLRSSGRPNSERSR